MSNYEMRPLKTLDIFAMSKILKKLEIKLDMSEGMTQDSLGVQMFQKIAENLHLAQDDVNKFLADLVGIKAKEFNELPIEETIEIIEQFKDQKGLKNFLKLAGK